MKHSALIILVVAVCTAFIRFLPFLLFGEKRPTPAVLTYLSGVLPAAVMAMLVVYCLRNLNIRGGSHGLPEFVSIIVVSASYVWKRSTLLSILSGTVLYMLLIQLVF